MTALEHAQWVAPFLRPAERARYAELACDSKARRRLLDRLCHRYADVLDWRFARPIPPVEQTWKAILQQLLAAGAMTDCYVLCHSDEWDGQLIPLEDAVRQLVGTGLPMLLVCRAERVAYFEPEDESGPGRSFVLLLPAPQARL